MSAAQLDRTFAALADPTRRAMLKRLTEGEATLTELAAPFPVSVQAVAKHLRVLEEAGLVTRRTNGQLRPARLRYTPLRQAAGWIGDYQRFWERGFDRMAVRLSERRG